MRQPYWWYTSPVLQLNIGQNETSAEAKSMVGRLARAVPPAPLTHVSKSLGVSVNLVFSLQYGSPTPLNIHFGGKTKNLVSRAYLWILPQQCINSDVWPAIAVKIPNSGIQKQPSNIPDIQA